MASVTGFVLKFGRPQPQFVQSQNKVRRVRMTPDTYETCRGYSIPSCNRIPTTQIVPFRSLSHCLADFAVFLHALALVTHLGCETRVSRLGRLDVSCTWVTPEGISRISLILRLN